MGPAQLVMSVYGLYKESLFTEKSIYRTSRAGFTLVELMVSASVIVIISSLVITRFTAFDGTVVLRSSAYDVATSLREAQIYSVSVANTGVNANANFRYPYGLTFSPDAPSYTFFRYDNSDTTNFPKYAGDAFTKTVLRVMGLNGSTKIKDICVAVGAGYECSSTLDISRLDISFRRPEFSALIYTPEIPPASISGAKILLESERSPGNVWVVEIKLLGQITVYKKP